MTDTTFALAIGEDTSRARRSDPDTSHMAADTSAPQISKLQAIVLGMVAASELGLTDSEIDAQYASRVIAEGWPVVRYETPRRRRSDLAGMGSLVDSGIRRLNPFGRPEVVWVLA